jgi:membrane protease YdiL (CAAX protease family)
MLWSFWQKLHRECLAEANSENSRDDSIASSPSSCTLSLDKEPLIAMLTVTISLVLIQTFAKNDYWFQATWAKYVPQHFKTLGSQAHWAIVTIFCYTIPPLATILLQRRNPRDYGLKMSGMLKHAWIYIPMICVMCPIVWFAAERDAFLWTYPFYRQANRSWTDLLIWESLYAMQFVTLEFFFRGYMLGSLRKKLGVYSIFVMMIPYCMIHFNKPTLETFASIIAGIALGTAALATRSIWWGAILHIAVAWSMDALAISRMG